MTQHNFSTYIPLSQTKKKKGSHTNNKVTAIEHFLVSAFVIRAIQYLLVICRILEEYMSGTKIDIGQQIPVNNSRKTENVLVKKKTGQFFFFIGWICRFNLSRHLIVIYS